MRGLPTAGTVCLARVFDEKQLADTKRVSVEASSTSRHIYVFSTQKDGCFQSQLALRYQLIPCSYALQHSLVPDSDSLYHRLFSLPQMVEGLVREFVPRELVAGLDFSGLQLVNPKFHPSRRSARRREGDVIWRLPTREGSDIYFHAEREIMPNEACVACGGG